VHARRAEPLAVELLHERIPLPLIQRQLGHLHLSTTGALNRGFSGWRCGTLRLASAGTAVIVWPWHEHGKQLRLQFRGPRGVAGRPQRERAAAARRRRDGSP
jgi:hypothetical protein